MERIAVFVDDAGHARHLLQSLLSSATPARWFVVMCPPRLTRHAGRWLSNQQRRQWRAVWSNKLREELAPLFAGCSGNQMHWQLAEGALAALTEKLQRREGLALRVLDARRPRLGHASELLTPSQPTSPARYSGYCTATRTAHGTTSTQVSRLHSRSTAGSERHADRSPVTDPIIRPTRGHRTRIESVSPTAYAAL